MDIIKKSLPPNYPPPKPRPPLNQFYPNHFSRTSGYGSIGSNNQARPAHVAIDLPPVNSNTRPTSKVPASGPLGRVPSYPCLIPFMKVDLDAVAEEVSRSVGAEVTASQMLESLADRSTPNLVQDHSQEVSSAELERSAVLDHGGNDSIDPPVNRIPDLQVEILQTESADFWDEAKVLKIKQKQDTGTHETLNLSNGHPRQRTDSLDKPESDAMAGFAINIPVQKMPKFDPFVEDTSSPWEQHYVGTNEGMDVFDEEDPLLDKEAGVDMSCRSSFQRSVLVQRKGARNNADEQEVLYEVPEDEDINSKKTGLLLPVLDSKEDLRQLMLVVPPDSDKLETDVKHAIDEERPETVGRIKFGSMERFRNRLPPIAEVDSKLEAHGSAVNATVAMQVTNKVSWVGYAVLLVALFSVASQGIAVKWLPSVDGLVSATWLMQAQTLFLIPFALYDYLNLSKQEMKSLLELSTRWQIVTASLAQVFWSSGFFFAIDHTSLFHAWSLNNSHALLIVLGTLLGGAARKKDGFRISSGEIIGAEIALAGVLVMIFPPLLTGKIEMVAGDLVAIVGSLGAIVFLDRCKTLRKKIPLFLMMAPISALNAVLLSIGSMLITGSDFSMTDHGALGWLKADRIILGLYMGGVSGFLGMVSCIAALKYLPSVVVGSVQTMMPVTGTVVAVLAGFDTLPDIWTTIGGAVMLFGVLTIANTSRDNKVKVVINHHIKDSSS